MSEVVMLVLEVLAIVCLFVVCFAILARDFVPELMVSRLLHDPEQARPAVGRGQGQ
jgi:hypothetical protein